MKTLKAVLGAVWDFARHSEPVAVVHAITAVAAFVVAARAGKWDVGLFVAAWLAVQAALIRRVVTPMPAVPAGLQALVAPESPPK